MEAQLALGRVQDAREALRALHATVKSWREVHRLTGLPLGTAWHIAHGHGRLDPERDAEVCRIAERIIAERTAQLALFDLEGGLALRDEGIEAVSDRDPDWMELGMLVLRHVARRVGRFSTDDLRAAGLDEPPEPNLWGALIQGALKGGVIRSAGMFVQSQRPEARGRWIRVWEGVPGKTGAGP